MSAMGVVPGVVEPDAADDVAVTWCDRVRSHQRRCRQGRRRLAQGGAGAGDVEEGVEEREVVGGAVVTGVGDVDAGVVEVAGVGLYFVAQHVVRRGLDEGRWQAPQLLGGGQ
jgi:hypothetical protein